MAELIDKLGYEFNVGNLDNLSGRFMLLLWVGVAWLGLLVQVCWVRVAGSELLGHVCCFLFARSCSLGHVC